MVLFMGSIFFCTRAISYIEYILKKNRDKTYFAQMILLLQRFVKKKKIAKRILDLKKREMLRSLKGFTGLVRKVQ